MKKLTMSLMASTVLAGALYAESSSLSEAFEKGKASGEISVYTQSKNMKTSADSGYTMNSTSLNYSTDSIKGFTANLGFMNNHKISEKVIGDMGVSASEMNVANVSYAIDGVAVTVGRQAIDLEWIADYHEAITAVVTTIPNTTIVLGHTDKFTANASDGAVSKFADIGPKGDGASVADVTYKISDDMSVNAYYMDAKDVFSAVGGKFEGSFSGLGVTAKYAKSSEDNASKEDGNVMSLALGYDVSGISLGAGYVKTDKDGGIGNLATLNSLNSNNPFEFGDNVLGTDAKTVYGSVGTNVAGFDLGATYGTTDYESTKTDKELDIYASWECKFVKNLNVSVLYADVNADATGEDYSFYEAQLVYSF